VLAIRDVSLYVVTAAAVVARRLKVPAPPMLRST
jgi:hypothetical protein